jgi:hypothetical protein
MRLVNTLVLGITLVAVVPGLHGQAKPANAPGTSTTSATAKATPAAAKPADKPAAKVAAQAPAKPGSASAPQNKPAAATNNKPTASGAKPTTSATNAKPAKQGAKPATAAPKPKQARKSTSRAEKPAASAANNADKEPKVAKRDPFESLVGREHGGGPTGPMPPGKAGLQVSTLRLDGIVRAPTGMIAVVSNPQSRTYFLREGDQLYDGRVEKIAMDGVSFHEVGKDAFGKPVERQVSKRIYASAGEQQ